MNSVDSRASNSVRVRLAQREDAEKITTVINSAFRGAEFFFVEGDRVEVGEVLNFLSSGKFLLAEREHTLLGCVYVEPGHLDSNRSPAGSEGRAYLGLLAVDPGAQQSGLGSSLTLKALAIFSPGFVLKPWVKRLPQEISSQL